MEREDQGEVREWFKGLELSTDKTCDISRCKGCQNLIDVTELDMPSDERHYLCQCTGRIFVKVEKWREKK